MSRTQQILSHFTDRARGEGLITPGYGRHIAETREYQEVMSRMSLRQSRADAMLRGSSFAGMGRLDARASTNPRFDAEMRARTLEWAEYFAARYPGHNVGAHVGPASVLVNGLYHQSHGARGSRYDATVPMASQGLTYIFPEVYRFQHNNLPCWDEEFLKIARDVPPAANEYAWYEMDNVGTARASNSYDITTIPMVNGPIASDNKGLIIPALVGMETNFMDPRREAFAVSQGKPDFQVEMMKREACDRVLAEFIDALWFGGDATLGVDGLMNNPIVTTLEITGGPWSGKTSAAILADLTTMVYAIANRTAGALGDLGKIRMLLPPDQYQRLINPQTAAGSASIMEYFMDFFRKAGRGVPSLEMQFRLAASNSAAYNGGPNLLAEDTALILYEDGDKMKDPTFVLSQPIEVPAPVRVTGVGDVTYFHARAGGMRLPDARRIQYVVGL